MIEVIRCGHDSRHTRPLDMVHSGLSHHLLLLIKADAYVETEHGTLPVHPGTAVVFDKDRRIHYGCHEKNYNDDWIRFSVSPDDGIFAQAGIRFGEPFEPHAFLDIAQYVRLLVGEKYLASADSPRILDALMRALLLKLGTEQRFETVKLPGNRRYYAQLSRLREEVLNAPGQKWELEELAARANMSLSYFQHQYRALFGVPCRKDIILARLENSKFYLRETEMDIAAVASFCGYEDEIHFMKQFKKFEGMTPTQYRCRESAPHTVAAVEKAAETRNGHGRESGVWAGA